MLSSYDLAGQHILSQIRQDSVASSQSQPPAVDDKPKISDISAVYVNFKAVSENIKTLMSQVPAFCFKDASMLFARF